MPGAPRGAVRRGRGGLASARRVAGSPGRSARQRGALAGRCTAELVLAPRAVPCDGDLHFPAAPAWTGSAGPSAGDHALGQNARRGAVFAPPSALCTRALALPHPVWHAGRACCLAPKCAIEPCLHWGLTGGCEPAELDRKRRNHFGDVRTRARHLQPSCHWQRICFIPPPRSCIVVHKSGANLDACAWPCGESAASENPPRVSTAPMEPSPVSKHSANNDTHAISPSRAPMLTAFAGQPLSGADPTEQQTAATGSGPSSSQRLAGATEARDPALRGGYVPAAALRHCRNNRAASGSRTRATPDWSASP